VTATNVRQVAVLAGIRRKASVVWCAEAGSSASAEQKHEVAMENSSDG